MPCVDERAHNTRAPFDPHNNPQAEMLCEVLRSLIQEDIDQFSKPVRDWWEAHQARDAKRLEKEKLEKEIAEAEKEMIAKRERLAKL